MMKKMTGYETRHNLSTQPQSDILSSNVYCAPFVHTTDLESSFFENKYMYKPFLFLHKETFIHDKILKCMVAYFWHEIAR